ncbi:MAG TPA: glutamate-1-semialdehyde 2,1-aminomutase [Candidatus Eremiobacteraceae bacterium]|nr:glutamate-1-semialdehyde 2,1-aminomutase [Candidatus Eremiobacteraceae bacterium]
MTTAPREERERRYARAQQAIAGGVCSPVRAGAPVGGPPPMLVSASGARVVDADGREYVDYQCAYGPVLLGHAPAAVTAAVGRAAAAGAVFGSTHPEEVRLAERLTRAMPSMQRMRFVSTGTEACASALRVARAFTGRPKFIRFAGNYHGHTNEMIFSAGASTTSAAGLAGGVPQGVVDDAIVLPYNDIGAVAAALSRYGGQIAAVMLEPVVGNMGLVLPDDGFLASLRSLATLSGAVLIFDEVITGLRLGLGGAQALYGVQPDLTCVGKALGGGLPIAAFGGRAAIMAMLAPDGPVFQGGTFSGNPLCVAAAHAVLDALENDPLLYATLDARANRLARGARDAIADAGLSYPVVQIGSIVDFMFRDGPPPRNFDQASQADGAAYARYYWAMLERGVHLAPSQMEVMFVTAAHSDDDIDRTVAAIRASLHAD